jgi:diguanylate cyclase (GGDEF)-like protein
LSTHDSLTGLPNRFMFDELLSNAVQLARLYNKPFGLMFVDLDRFKFVNDTLGHAAGDALLLEIATRLKANLRLSDVVARLGGDEFVVIFHDFVGFVQAEAIALTISEALAEPCSLDGHEYVISASIGLALYPDDASEARALLKCADAAMYQVKREGKNGVRHFTAAIAAPSIQRLDMEAALRHGLERKEFVLHYQLKRAIATQAVSGAEALLRWRHPDLGLLLPDKFICLAEETGLIVPIGRWVIETACRQAESWRRTGLPDFPVAVNLSPRQFADDGLIRVIQHALGVCGTPAKLPEIEITESMAMRDSARSEAIIRQIRALNVRVSIDDFGAGHSSMARLKHLSIDGIKIDRGFVRGIAVDVRDRAIVEAICSLGKALQLEVVGEGVETAEQEALLAELRCDEIQGFLFARPMPAEQIPDFVREYELARLGKIEESSRRSGLTVVEELGARIA